MTNRTINDEIIDIITHELNKIAFPSECEVIKIYGDNHADVKSDVYGSINYVKIYGSCSLGDKGILLFLNNDLSNPCMISENY